MENMTVHQLYTIIYALLGLLIAIITIYQFKHSHDQSQKKDDEDKISNLIKVGMLPTTLEINKLNGFIEGILKTTEELKASDDKQTATIMEMKEDIARHEGDIKNLYKTTSTLQKLHME